MADYSRAKAEYDALDNAEHRAKEDVVADYTSRRVVQKARIEYVLPNPTNWAEINKVMDVIHQATQGYKFAGYDDLVLVTADDDEIIFSYEEE
jgi:hypothetical protein